MREVSRRSVKPASQTLSVFNYTLDELRSIMREMGLEPFRANQIYNWLFKKRELNVDRYTDISPKVRPIIRPLIRTEMEILKVVDSEDNSSKFLLKLPEGDVVETVLMRHVKNGQRRYTVCLSTQLGCPVGCKFCASGKHFRRSLSPGEIVEQLWHVQKYLDQTEGVRVSNIVYMGMGEPLLNYDATVKSLRIICDDRGFNISTRNITLSTVGIPDAIRRLAHDAPRVKLAFSLHSPREEVRRWLIPLARKFSLEEILDALRYYWDITKRRITIEYVLLEGINDTEEDAREIVKLFASPEFKGVRLLINLIPYNPVEGVGFKAPSEERIERFAAILSEHFDVTVRRSMGRDVKAACGQLRYRVITQLFPTSLPSHD